MTSEFPPDDRERDPDRERRRLERLIPEIIKRVVETGYEKLTEAPDNVRDFVSEMKLPKEALALILAQIDDTKTGLYRVVAKEIRDFLAHTNVADELARALTALSFEMKTEVRFIPNEKKSGAPRPDVKASVRVRRTPSTDAPPPDEEAKPPEDPRT